MSMRTHWRRTTAALAVICSSDSSSPTHLAMVRMRNREHRSNKNTLFLNTRAVKLLCTLRKCPVLTALREEIT
eukprot:01791_1